MMKSPEQIAPDCIRTFDGEGWCVFELRKTSQEWDDIKGIEFWCERMEEEQV